MTKKIIIKYKNKSYIIEKKELESYDQFYDRAWILVKDCPDTKEKYKISLLESQKKINIKYLKYEY